MNSIGRSFQGRDINYLEIDMKDDQNKNKPAILITGATHARELISTSFNMFQVLKLLMKGVVEKSDKYQSLLQQNKYYFIPILNVDGVALIEDGWNKDHKIIPQRKNLDKPDNCAATMESGNTGVDLNRNFAIDFGQVDDIVSYQSDDWMMDAKDKKDKKADPCIYNFPGTKPFSEPETIAFKNFLTEKQKELVFVLNVHSNGNAFIYPFNGRQVNDIETRRPGIMQIFSQISKDAPVPVGEMKGTSKETMGIAIGGDQDDWTLDALGIPSATAELGFVGQFIDEWNVRDSSTATDIMMEQSGWVEYIYQHLGEFAQIVRNQTGPVSAAAPQKAAVQPASASKQTKAPSTNDE